jgi:shikimate kinase
VIIYLLGPSGVGKSNAANLLQLQKTEFSMVDIDEEFRGREFDWNAIRPRLSQLHEQSVNDSRIVVDVGAGTQTLHDLYKFLQKSQALVVVVTAPPEEVILRQPICNRELAEFVRTEYTTRAALFGLAKLTIDVGGLAGKEAAQKVVDQIHEFLATAP